MKAKQLHTFSPANFALGETIFYEDVGVVLEAWNYAVGEVVEGYSASCAVPFRNGDVVKVGTVYVPPHAQALFVETSTTGTGTGSLNVDIGSGSVPLATGSQQSASIATLTTGTGLINWQVTTVLTAGNLDLTRVTIRAVAITPANLPAPEDE